MNGANGFDDEFGFLERNPMAAGVGLKVSATSGLTGQKIVFLKLRGGRIGGGEDGKGQIVQGGNLGNEAGGGGEGGHLAGESLVKAGARPEPAHNGLTVIGQEDGGGEVEIAGLAQLAAAHHGGVAGSEAEGADTDQPSAELGEAATGSPCAAAAEADAALKPGAVLGVGMRPFRERWGIDQDQPGDLGGILGGELADHQGAEGVANQEIRRSGGLIEQLAQFGDQAGQFAGHGSGLAPAQAGTIIGKGGGKLAHTALDEKPAQGGAAEGGIHDHGGAGAAVDGRVELGMKAAAAHLPELAWRRQRRAHFFIIRARQIDWRGPQRGYAARPAYARVGPGAPSAPARRERKRGPRRFA